MSSERIRYWPRVRPLVPKAYRNVDVMKLGRQVALEGEARAERRRLRLLKWSVRLEEEFERRKSK